MRASKVTIGRLYNLGSYEHVRYDVTVELSNGDSAQAALVALEKIMEALKPERSCCVHTRGELDRELFRCKEMRKLLRKDGADVFRQRHGHFEGTPLEYIRRCEQSYAADMKKRLAYEKRAKKARELLDSLGGAAKWKDAKLDWENDDVLDEL